MKKIILVLVALLCIATPVLIITIHYREMINAYDDEGRTRLINAACEDRWGEVRALIAVGADVNKAMLSLGDYRSGGITVLMIAALRAEPVVIDALLAANADVNAVDNVGTTALCRAIGSENIYAVKALVKAGAGVFNSNKNSEPAFLLAAESENGEIFDFMLTLIPGSDSPGLNAGMALSRCIKRGKIDRVKALLEAGADVNWPDAEGWTALMSAQVFGPPELTRLLLEAGADKDVVDDSGYSPLAMAIINRNRGAIRMLKAGGALLTVPW